MRILSAQFLSDLKTGHLLPLLERVKYDFDLDLNIRDGYLNIYYKGHSLLNLNSIYEVRIANEFRKTLNLPQKLSSATEVDSYLQLLPFIKENIIFYKSHTKSSFEIEYEQLLIRSNNIHLSVNTDVFITDRQYTDPNAESRFDLTGVLWPAKNRRSSAPLPLVFVEVKYSLNTDIQEIDKQIGKYYAAVSNKIQHIADETEDILKTKIDLGLLNQDSARLLALKGKSVSNNIDEAIFIVALIDYNPNSTLWNTAISKLQQLPFRNQIKIFNCGFGIWDNHQRLISI